MQSNGTATDALGAGELEEISEADCWQLLGSREVGRLVEIVGHYPLVFPVSYALDYWSILCRTGAGTKLHLIHRSNVTFEVDSVDSVQRTGWSVMVKGVAQVLGIERSPAPVSRADPGGATREAPGERIQFIRILADEITGRRIRPRSLPPATDLRGYL
jgi:nitroimidazol reductase NimA-like FMN-containing flavoprotein (pyridoxamine 5'-phosphate oxidase superfamily)